MTPAISIRDATDEDGAVVQRLVFKVLTEYGLVPDPDDTDSDLAHPASHYRDRGGHFWVMVTGNGAIIGTCGLMPTGPGTVELRKMYLDENHRGRGLGRRLLRHACAVATGEGYREMELETASVLTEAIALYRQEGFVRLPGRPGVPRCDQRWAKRLN